MRFTTSLKTINDQSDIHVLILGSELTPRKKGYGPKSLMRVGNKFNVIECQIDTIRSVYPKANITLITGYMSQEIINKGYGVSIIENPFFLETSHVEDLRIGLNSSLANKILVVGGDVVFDTNALLKLKGKSSCIMLDTTSPNNPESIGVTQNNDVAEILAYGLKNRWCNVSLFEGRELSMLRKFSRNAIKSKIMLFEAINAVIHDGGLMRTVDLGNASCYNAESRL